MLGNHKIQTEARHIPPVTSPLQHPCSLRSGKRDGNSLWIASGPRSTGEFGAVTIHWHRTHRTLQSVAFGGRGSETENCGQFLGARCRDLGGTWPLPTGQPHQHPAAKPCQTEDRARPSEPSQPSKPHISSLRSPGKHSPQPEAARLLSCWSQGRIGTGGQEMALERLSLRSTEDEGNGRAGPS